MSTTQSNLVEGKGRRVVLVLLPMILMPLALVGVTAKPALDLRAAKGHARDAQLRADDAQQLRAQLRATEPVEDLAARALILDQALLKLVPGELGRLELYSVLRGAADRAQFNLDILQVSDADVFRGPLDGRTIGRREVVLKGVATSSAVGVFVDHLRSAGLPTAVDSFTFSRRPNSQPFDVELKLGVFHRIPASAAVEDPSQLEEELAPQ